MEAQTQPTKRCPMCGEEVLAVAIKCRHCQSMIGGPVIVQQPPPAPAYTSSPAPATKRPTFGPYTIARTAVSFWLGSLLGFAVYGFISASMLGGRVGAVAAVMGGLAAGALGVPAALFFGATMRRVKPDAPWPAALVMAGVLTALAFFPMRIFTDAVLGDRGYVQEPAVFVVLAAVAMFGGAVAATLRGRQPAKAALGAD